MIVISWIYFLVFDNVIAEPFIKKLSSLSELDFEWLSFEIIELLEHVLEEVISKCLTLGNQFAFSFL